ncbi:MAG: 23S rRNA (pseudouridine(1915)-N(3))-methyltransferase RlmH [Alphaproteobacteria bacterium]
MGRSGPRPPSDRCTTIRLYLLAIGRLRRGPLHDVQALYAGRLAPPVTITELEEKRPLPPAALKLREAELILAARPAGARLVALDRTGAAWTSRDFADRLAAWRDGGAAAIAFAIGGAEGLATGVVESADAVMSLGKMTWPHLFVRSMLLEQLYRAQQIHAGHPYHRD